MDVHIADKYKETLFSEEFLQLYCEMIKSDTDIIKVLQLFIENEIRRLKKLIDEGITKKQIMELKVMSRKLDKGSNTFINAEIKMTKPKCNNIISYLSGATLVYYDHNEKGREKPYYLTKRGVQVCTKLIRERILNKPNI